MTIEQKIAFIENYKKSKNAASGSKYDANANVTDKNIASLAWEVPKKDNIDLNREMMIRKLDEKYGDGYSKKYIADLNSHIIYKHDETSLIHPYCCSISMYPFLLEGLQSLGGTSGVPKSTSSFCGSFINLSFLISSQFAGALATPEFLTYLDYFLRKDYGDDYYKRPDAVIELGSRTRTIEQKVTDYFQQIVYSINQPAAARGYQSIFWNIAYFDKYYFESIFEGFYFPDGDQPKWNSVSWLQKKFMKWFNKERTKAVLTFPVETLNLLTDENGYRDKEWAEFAAEMLAEGHSFFIYRSNSVDALASCCFSKDQKVLTRSSSGGVYLSTFKEIYDAKWRDKKCNFKIFHNGSWVEGKVVRFKSKNMFEVITMNNKKLIVSEDHLNCTIDGNKRTDELTTNDYLLMNSIKLDAVPEQDLKLTYEQGYLIGLYAGDGSKSKKTNEVVFSLNEEKNRKSIELLEKALKDLNENERIFRESMYGNLLSARISSKKVKDFISEWVFGDSADTKEINLNCLTQSSEFRQGIINGMYDSDGGNNNRIYSCSEKLIESLEVIFSSLGYNTIINEEDRRDEKVIINNEEFNRNFVSRCIRWYESKNRRSMADVYITKNNSTYFKIKSITPVEYEDEFMYCFEMKNQDEPYFTLPNNIITHNCRLRNAVEENTFSYTLGAGAIQTGSKGVITMNLNRIVQDWYRETEDKTMASLSNYLAEIVKRVHVYLSAFNDIIWDDYNAGLLTVFKAGFIDLDKQYLTLGM